MPKLNVAIPPGVVRGATPLDAPGRWWDTSLVRWRSGQLEPIGGWVKINATAMADAARAIYTWRTNADSALVAVGTETKLYIDNGDGLTDRSPSALQSFVSPGGSGAGGYSAGDYGEENYGDARSVPYEGPVLTRPAAWTFANFGEDLVAVSSADGRLLYWTPTAPVGNATEAGAFSLSSIQRASNVVTVTTTKAHGYVNGRSVTIAGVSTSSFNGTFTITSVPSTTTFTYAQTASDAGPVANSGTVRLTNVPQGNRAVFVTPERHVVLLGANGVARRVAWSSREDATDWNYTSSTNTAGYLELDAASFLITGKVVQQGSLIWSDRDLYLMTFIGSPFVYSINRVGETSLYNPNMVTTIAGRAMWLGKGGFYFYDGNLRLLECPVVEYVLGDIDPVYGPYRAFAAANGTFPEAWFFYPSQGNTECNRYVVYNYFEGWWAIGEMSRTAMAPSGARTYPIAGDKDGFLYDHERGWLDGNNTRIGQVYAESAVLQAGNDGRNLVINQAIPATGRGYDSMKLEFYARQTAEGSERMFGPYSARSDGYMDVRVNGRDVRVRVENGKDGDWALGTMRLDVQTGADR